MNSSLLTFAFLSFIFILHYYPLVDKFYVPICKVTQNPIS